jgi:limonene 1,2-monooxygenase
MRFGAFMAPFHPPGQDPTRALRRDLDLVVLMDELGFDEVWVGEHHSGGMEIIPSPELFIAVAAERTRHIRLGTGVISLPYHNPFMVAHRMALLDHLTRGRVMLGCGPGQLASDAWMLGLHPDDLRPRMQEALDVILALLRGEVVSVESDWYRLRDARLQLTPWSGDGFEVAVTGTISSNGARAAGRHGLGLLSMTATTPAGFGALRGHWHEYAKMAADHGHVADRAKWRCVGPVHLAATRQQAREEIGYGIRELAGYFHQIIPGGLWKGSTVDELVASNDETRTAIIGTPEDAIERIEEIVDESGGFGTFLIMLTDWADLHETRRSLELFSKHVMPHFTGRANSTARSALFVEDARGRFAEDNLAAIMKVGRVESRPKAREPD